MSTGVSEVTDRQSRRDVEVTRWAWIAVLLDVVVVLAFVSIGRSSHTEGVTVTGVASTAWPFLVGVAVGWLVGRVWHRPMSLVPGGLSVWLGAVVVGMVLRLAAGQGTAFAFTLVATGFLGATMFGWRLVARAFRLSPARP